MRLFIMGVLLSIFWIKSYAQKLEEKYPEFNKLLVIKLLEIDSNKLINKQDIQINFSIENVTPDSIFISDPYYWVNLDPFLYQGGQLLPQTLRVKPILGMREAKVLIKPGEKRMFTFSYFLSEVYSTLYRESGNFKLYIKNTGNIWDKHQKLILKEYKLSSNIVSFSL
jgi:hypothetical protein